MPAISASITTLIVVILLLVQSTRECAAQSNLKTSTRIARTEKDMRHPTLKYPSARRGDQIDDYHGTTVADPYRWLEDPNSDETRSLDRGPEQSHSVVSR